MDEDSSVSSASAQEALLDFKKSCQGCVQSKVKCVPGVMKCLRCERLNLYCEYNRRKRRSRHRKRKDVRQCSTPSDTPNSSARAPLSRPDSSDNASGEDVNQLEQANLLQTPPWIGSTEGDAMIVKPEPMSNLAEYSQAKKIAHRNSLSSTRTTSYEHKDTAIDNLLPRQISPKSYQLPEGFVLSTNGKDVDILKTRLERYAKNYFVDFAPHLPLIHEPTFELSKACCLLIKSICALGTLSELEEDSAVDGYILFNSLAGDLFVAIANEDSSNIEKIHALLLYEVVAIYLGDFAIVLAQYVHSMLVRSGHLAGLFKSRDLYRSAKILTISHNTRFGISWKQWVEQEVSNRTMWAIFALDCFHTITYETPPLLNVFNIGLPWPSPEPYWSSMENDALAPLEDTSYSFQSLLKQLLDGKADELKSQNVDEFGVTMCAFALHSELCKSQTSVLCRVDCESFERALELWKDWWDALEGIERGRPSPVFSLTASGPSLYQHAKDSLCMQNK